MAASESDQTWLQVRRCTSPAAQPGCIEYRRISEPCIKRGSLSPPSLFHSQAHKSVCPTSIQRTRSSFSGRYSTSQPEVPFRPQPSAQSAKMTPRRFPVFRQKSSWSNNVYRDPLSVQRDLTCRTRLLKNRRNDTSLCLRHLRYYHWHHRCISLISTAT